MGSSTEFLMLRKFPSQFLRKELIFICMIMFLKENVKWRFVAYTYNSIDFQRSRISTNTIIMLSREAKM